MAVLNLQTNRNTYFLGLTTDLEIYEINSIGITINDKNLYSLVKIY